MRSFNQNRRRRWRAAVILPPACGLLLALAACTTIKDTAKVTARTVSDTSRKMTSVFTPGGSDLRHKIALIGIESQPAPGSSGFPSFFQKAVAGFLQNDCRGSVVDPAVGEVLKSPPRLASGQIDGYALALTGRGRGLNFFVIGTLSDIRLEDEKTGFWLWKDTRYKIRALLRVEIIDSATGTKALDETFTEEMVTDAVRYQQLKEGGPPPFADVEPLLNRLLPEAGEKICTALNNQPWQGFVVAAGDGRITISSGSAVGLSPGMELAVFGSSRTVESKDGRRFLQPGDRVGEAQVSSVSAEKAEALLRQAAPPGPGATVRLK